MGNESLNLKQIIDNEEYQLDRERLNKFLNECLINFQYTKDLEESDVMYILRKYNEYLKSEFDNKMV